MRKGYSLVEVLVVIFVIAVTTSVWKSVSGTHGTLLGVLAGIVAGGVCLGCVWLFYIWIDRRFQRKLNRLRDDYRLIYRVNKVPDTHSIIALPTGAEIREGDYGWEAGPRRSDGLIYLQGLTPDWKVVWHAGFSPSQLELVCEKPNSQYGAWYPEWAAPPLLPACPYTVVERETPTIGRPHPSHSYFIAPTA